MAGLWLLLSTAAVLLALHLLAVSTLPGLFLIVLPAELLWDSGYRGSLIDWGDGWVWLTPAGLAIIYGPVVAAVLWLLSRLRRNRRRVPDA